MSYTSCMGLQSSMRKKTKMTRGHIVDVSEAAHTYATDLTLLILFPLLLLLTVIAGCSPKNNETPQQRSEAAKILFERTSKEFHIPSAEAKGIAKENLQNQAAAGYEELLKRYPEQEYWAAQALRSLGNIRAAQGKVDDSVRNYAAVEAK